MRRLLQCLVCLCCSSPAWAQERVADLSTTPVEPPSLRFGRVWGETAPVPGGMVWQVRYEGPNAQRFVEFWRGSLQDGVSPIRSFVDSWPEGDLGHVQPAGGKFLFRAGVDDDGGSRRLYVSDGTRAGTYRLHDTDAYNTFLHLHLWRGQLLALTELSDAIELSELDLATGQSRVVRSWPSLLPTPIQARHFISVQDALYFGLRHPQTGLQLLTTAGSVEGTEVRYELGTAEIYLHQREATNGVEVFAGVTPEAGLEAWAWDSHGPRPLPEVAAGPEDGIKALGGFVPLAGNVAFLQANGMVGTTNGLTLGQIPVADDQPEVTWVGIFTAGELTFLLDAELSLWLVGPQLGSRRLLTGLAYSERLNGVLWTAAPHSTPLRR